MRRCVVVVTAAVGEGCAYGCRSAAEEPMLDSDEERARSLAAAMGSDDADDDAIDDDKEDVAEGRTGAGGMEGALEATIAVGGAAAATTSVVLRRVDAARKACV